MTRVVPQTGKLLSIYLVMVRLILKSLKGGLHLIPVKLDAAHIIHVHFNLFGAFLVHLLNVTVFPRRVAGTRAVPLFELLEAARVFL